MGEESTKKSTFLLYPCYPCYSEAYIPVKMTIQQMHCETVVAKHRDQKGIRDLEHGACVCLVLGTVNCGQVHVGFLEQMQVIR